MPLVHFRDVIASSSMPWSLQGPVIYRSYLHMAKALRNIWQTGYFFLHVISPFQCRQYYIHTVLTPRHSAYGTWGIICQFLTRQGYFSYANFCLHALLFLMLFSFYPSDLGYVARSAWLQVLTAWWHNGVMALLWDRKKGRKARETAVQSGG